MTQDSQQPDQERSNDSSAVKPEDVDHPPKAVSATDTPASSSQANL